MDPYRFGYSPVIERPKLAWPNGARVAVWVCPNIEHYEYVPAEVRVRNPVAAHAASRRAGLWRPRLRQPGRAVAHVRGARQAHDALHGLALDVGDRDVSRDPRGHGGAALGIHEPRLLQHALPLGLWPEEEREVIEHSKATHLRLTGRKLRGWFSPAVSNTLNTPDLVKEAGLDYFCDFYHDDQPTPLATKHGTLIHVPYTMDINDAMIYRQPVEAEEFAQMIVDHFDTVYREGSENGRVMCIALHPYMMGAPHRLKHLDRALAYIRKHKDAWICTAEEILDWYVEQRAQALPAASRQGGVR